MKKDPVQAKQIKLVQAGKNLSSKNLLDLKFLMRQTQSEALELYLIGQMVETFDEAYGKEPLECYALTKVSHKLREIITYLSVLKTSPDDALPEEPGPYDL